MYTPNPAYYSSLNNQGGLLNYVWNNITPNGAGSSSNSSYNYKNQYNNNNNHGQQQQHHQQPGGQQNQNNRYQHRNQNSFRRLG